MRDAGWAADNLAFGSGGALLQKLHRDTQKCAFKCSHALVNGEGVDVVKDPVTDPGKKSKKGRLTLEVRDGVFTTVTEGKGDPSKDQLVEVFRDGHLLVDQTFAQIRERSRVGL
uniref:Nicotinamide phosphoribosyltransferase n=1 Tax=Alexandrium andersonii TaxID=327968 RepID=A0A7S2CAZ1_9DINO|mmetsp:Transcript_35809/g.81328  ORF Transcript_35809/g.81328 Transcript_35809/m.81328 type:complete len:114 (+) Transcript_35809:3-344(+)